MFFMENQQKLSCHQTLSLSIIDIVVGAFYHTFCELELK